VGSRSGIRLSSHERNRSPLRRRRRENYCAIHLDLILERREDFLFTISNGTGGNNSTLRGKRYHRIVRARRRNHHGNCIFIFVIVPSAALPLLLKPSKSESEPEAELGCFTSAPAGPAGVATG